MTISRLLSHGGGEHSAKVLMRFDSDLIHSLEGFGHVLTVRLVDRLGPCAFLRDTELDLMQRHLDHGSHNSLVLVGPSGCGKTAILHELFRRVGTRADKPWLVLETSTTQLMAGTQYIGDWQTRIQDLVQLARRSAGIAVYFTDIHHIGDAGRSSKSDENMASSFAPFLENGELTLVGECTPDNFRGKVERLPSLHKLFGVFRVEESSPETARKIVAFAAESLAARTQQETGLKLVFPENTLAAVQEYGKIYFPGSAAPGGAVKLLEQVVSQKTNRSSPELNTDYAVTEQPPVEVELQYEDVVRTLESFTGIPSQLLDDSRPLKLSDVRQFFEARVLGQQAAVDVVVDLITLVKAGLTDPGKPMASLFFVGPTGVGKTELAKALAEFIFGSADRLIRFDMSEFKDFHSFEKLIGGQNQREDSVLQHGSLLTRVRQQPFSVILLDEIEKAHPNIFDVLLQVFDDGRLTDPLGRTTNFTQTIIVMTSNLGSNLFEAPFGFNTNTNSEPNEQHGPLRAMEAFFRPEFLNRIDRVVTFKPLDRHHVRILAQRELGQVLLRSGITRRELRVDVDPGVIDILVREGFSQVFGARPLKRAVEKFALLPIARQIVNMSGDYRQALLRLLPSGQGIIARIVEDRQTRRQESLAKGVNVVDPIDGTKAKLKPAQIEERLADLENAVSGLEQQCRDRKLEEQRTDLLHQTTQVDFWDDQDAARQTFGEYYRIDQLLAAVGEVRKRTDSLVRQFQTARGHGDADRLATVAARSVEIRRHADLVKYTLDCRNEVDRSDAFVQLTVVEQDVPEDVVGLLADMYRNWAQRKGFQVRLVHEELAAQRVTKSLTLLIEGVAVYGILQGEDGIHEFILGRPQDLAKHPKCFVRVRVLPLVDDDGLQLTSADISVEKHRASGAGLRCKRYRSRVTVRHRPTSTTVTAKSEFAFEKSVPWTTDWLQAELYRNTHHPAVTADVEGLVRKYVLRPQPSARDSRTGEVVTNLNDLWDGEIDAFLFAAVAARNT